MLQETNFWHTTASRPAFPEQPLPASVDVALIGAGFTGLSAALCLAQGGASVAVLEAESAGWGASSRNGGMVLTGLKVGTQILIQKYGLERARRMYDLSLASIDTVEKLVRDHNIDCAFSRSGHIETAWKAAHYDGFARAAEVLEKEFGHKVRLVPKSELHSEIGSEIYHGALLDETSGGLNPAAYAWGLAVAAGGAGAQMHENTRVSQVEPAPAGFKVMTSRGALNAGRVLVATSGYTGGITAALRTRIIPIGSYIIVTEPLSLELAREVSPRNRMIFDSKNFLYYFRLTPDNRMLFGGRAAFRPETPGTVRDSAEILRRGMVGVFPQLRDVPVAHVWGGTLDFAYDLMPHTGRLDGLDFALGYAGHGVAFASHLGQLSGRAILGEKVENPFEGLPFPKVPLYNGNPALHLPLAWLYYRFLDWIS
jgi:glycine/D-amino acid oxidase-like deaminating enzyme